VEGHINRLKTLKRQMYGRASLPLLRARLLPEPPSVVQGHHQNLSQSREIADQPCGAERVRTASDVAFGDEARSGGADVRAGPKVRYSAAAAYND
jgi:hypothetical protein